MASGRFTSILKTGAALAASLLTSAAAQAGSVSLIGAAGPAPIELHGLMADELAFSPEPAAMRAQELTGAAVLYDFEGAAADGFLPAAWSLRVAHGADAYSACGAACSGIAGRWISETAAADGLDARLAIANTAVNAGMDYARDVDAHGEADAWIAADPDAQRIAGDCEDYALVKFWTLAAAGVPVEAMQILLVRDHVARADHAYLLVNTSDGVKLLDNRTDRVLTPEQLDAVVPVAAAGASGVWLYGRPRPSA